MIRKLKLLGQKLLVDTCRAEAARFLNIAERGAKGEEGIRASECHRYWKCYSIIADELEKDVDNLDKFMPSYLYEIWDVCTEEELILECDDEGVAIDSPTVFPKLTSLRIGM